MTGPTPLLLADTSRFQFQPTERSPLYRSEVTHAPSEMAAHPNVGAYQRGESWRPGCTFHPRCVVAKTDDALGGGAAGGATALMVDGPANDDGAQQRLRGAARR